MALLIEQGTGRSESPDGFPIFTAEAALIVPSYPLAAVLHAARRLGATGVVRIDTPQGTSRVFVRGGFAEVNQAGLILLAETAIPVDELSAEHLADEIKNAEEDVADTVDEQRRIAQERLDRLRELREALKF